MNQIYMDDYITLGHNLLSITDVPSLGIQPWKTPKGNMLLYNGEIFNYKSFVKNLKISSLKQNVILNFLHGD